MDKIQRIPFLRLLIPLLVGIILQYHTNIYQWSIIATSVGCSAMLLSYFISQNKQHQFRYLFGVGVYIFLFGVGIIGTHLRQQATIFTFPDISESYYATITDIPQEKPNTWSVKVKLDGSDRQIICYLPKDKQSKKLSVGDRISFFSQITPFKSLGNPNGFDYPTYMHNKGYTGTTYIKSDYWQKEKPQSPSIYTLAGKSRDQLIKYIQKLDLEPDQAAILSALTLGYKDSLSDDLVQSFRATGTAHILAISGIHVMIIFSALFALISSVIRSNRYRWLKYILATSLLWGYVLLVGCPPSAIRACIMLTAYSIAKIRGIDTYSLNTLFACAFCILIWNPLWLFDLGFQMSFAAVLSMLLILPKLSSLVRVKNKYLRYIWNTFTVSLAAQIGTLPLCLYYFGTFPSYFFATNILVIPLFCAILYVGLLIISLSILAPLAPNIIGCLLYIPVLIFKLIAVCLTQIISFFERLPFATIEGININLLSLFALWLALGSFIYIQIYKHSKVLMLGLVAVLFLIGTGIYNTINDKNSLDVLNGLQSSEIKYRIGYQSHNLESDEENQLLNLNGSSYLLVCNDKWKGSLLSSARKDIDYLHITGNHQTSLYSLSRIFNIKKVILDSSLSSRSTKRLSSECENLRIPYYDVSENGALRIFF